MIDEEIERYVEEHTTPENSVLAKLSRETHLTQMYPRMLAGHFQGTFLRMITHMLKPRRILEIGTFTGYSTICFASASTNPDSLKGESNFLLHTIEVDPELEDIIRKYLKEAGVEDKVVLHIGDAMAIIPTLDEEWDLVFIDADKPNYLNYYEMVFDRVKKGGMIIADNTLWSGKVLDPNPKGKDTIGIKQFNDFIQQDDRVENILLPVRDGIMMIRKI